MTRLNKNYLDRYSKQIVLKNIGISGQKKISCSKVFIVGAGGLGCPIADLLCRAGVGEIGIGSEGTPIGTGVTFLNIASSTEQAIAIDAPTSGIATVTITPGASLGMVLALGG